MQNMSRIKFGTLFASRRWGFALAAGAAALGVAAVPALGVSGASAASRSTATNIRIDEAEVTTTGDLKVKVAAQCPAGDNNYLYVEADQDLSTNDSAGHIYVSSFICKGWTQTVWATVPADSGTSHFEFNNDGEGDDFGTTFKTGDVGVSATFGGTSNFTMIERVLTANAD